MKWFLTACLVAEAWVTGMAAPAFAAQLDRFFGHSVEIRDYDDINKVLKIDGRDTIRDNIILLDEVTIVDGVPVLIGTRSAGGNACDGSPFVVSFPTNGNPRVDGPIVSCRPVNAQIEKDRILFSTSAVPGEGSDQWVWTFTDGLKSMGSAPFVPSDDRGWLAVRERSFDHPSDLFDNQQISTTMHTLLGDSFETVQRIFIGVGGGEYKNGDYVGHACTRHMCGEEEAIVYLFQETKSIYVAWKPNGEKIAVKPVVGAWPERAKIELRNWANKWK